MALVCRHVIVTGRVQGVAFRWNARAQAQELGVAGWVRNLYDGRVEAWIEGEATAVAAMLAWLERGPPAARVDATEVSEREPEGLAGFEVRRGA